MILGVGGALAVSAKAAIDFESSMASVAKTTDLAGNSFDANSGPLFKFGEALRGLALRTPVNVNELAEIAALGGQLGVEVPNLIEFTEVMAAMGVATNMSATEAAKGFARFANIMRTPEGDFDRLGSIVVELGNNFATTESEILTFATRLAPVGVVAGMTEEEVFGLSAALTSLGIPAERGGTALQRVFISMKQAVDTGSGALENFADVAGGVTKEAFQELFRESPAKAFAAFVKGLDDVSKAGGNVFAVLDRLNLSEQRTIQVLLATASGYQVVEDAIDSAADAGEENVALFEEARKRYGTTASQIQILGNAFNDLRLAVGNTVLGSGGLTFAIDAVTEFFGIIKENLPMLGRLATAFVVIGVARFAANLVQAGANAITATRNFGMAVTNIRNLGTAARAGQAGILLLNTAMSGVLAIGTLVAGIWAMQAIKAAELRAEIDQLNAAVEGGQDPGEALIAQMKENGTLTQAMIHNMNAAGLTTQDLANQLLFGTDALAEFGGETAGISEVIGRMIRAEGIAGQAGAWAKVQTGLHDYLLALDRGRPLVEGFYGNLQNRLVDLALSSNLDIPTAQLEKMVDMAVNLFGTDITDSEFMRWMKGETITDGWQVQFRQGTDAFGKDLENVEVDWRRFLQNLEGGDEIIEDFWQGSVESLDAFRDHMADSFADIDAAVRSGFPAWGEYEQVVIGATDESGNRVTASLDEVIAAMDQFLLDLGSFADAMPVIMEHATADTIAWIEELGPGLQGALGRMDPSALIAFLDQVDARFEVMAERTRQIWLAKMPAAARAGTAMMVQTLTEEVGAMELPAAEAADAFSERLMIEFALIPEQYQGEVMTYLAQLLANPEALEGMGIGAGDDWIAGLLLALQGMAKKVNTQLAREAAQIKKANQLLWLNTSPSKWWEGFGEDWMAGLEKGIISGSKGIASLLSPEVLLPSAMAGIDAGTSITNNRSRSQTVNLNFSSSAQGTVPEIQTALTLLNLVGGVEAGSGRWN